MKRIKIFHLADTHIGFSAYRKIDEATGLNQREVDTYNAFKQFVDYAVKEKPDVVLHAGDLFDSVRPTNRAIYFVLGEVIRLSDAGIPLVVIGGNHETPRLKETGSVFSLFEYIPRVHLIYRDKYEIVELDDGDRDINIRVHAIPHCDDTEKEKRKMMVDVEGDGEDRDNNDTRFNIALIHASVIGGENADHLPVFMMGDFNEQIVDIATLKKFDYIALGHYHRFTRVREDAYYAGSTERFSFSDAGDKKGFIELVLGKDGDGTREIELEFHQLKIREMVDLEPIDCYDLSEGEIKKAIKERVTGCGPDGKIIRLKVVDIPLYIYHSLDFTEIKRITRSAVHFEMKYEFRKEKDGDLNLSSAERPGFHSLDREFDRFISGYKIPAQINKSKLKELGLRYTEEWKRGCSS